MFLILSKFSYFSISSFNSGDAAFLTPLTTVSLISGFKY
jgi:hypothetical protein